MTSFSSQCVALIQSKCFAEQELSMLKSLSLKICVICDPMKEEKVQKAYKAAEVLYESVQEEAFLQVCQLLQGLCLNAMEKRVFKKIWSSIVDFEQQEFCEHLTFIMKGLAEGEGLYILQTLQKSKDAVSMLLALRAIIDPTSSLQVRYFMIRQLKELQDLGRALTLEALYALLLEKIQCVYLDCELNVSFFAEIVLDSQRELQISAEHPLCIQTQELQQFLIVREEFNEFCRKIPKDVWIDREYFILKFSQVVLRICQISSCQRSVFVQSVMKICDRCFSEGFVYLALFNICNKIKQKPMQATETLQRMIQFIESIENRTKEEMHLFLDICVRLEDRLSVPVIECLARLVQGLLLPEERCIALSCIDFSFPLEKVVRLCECLAYEEIGRTDVKERVFWINVSKQIIAELPDEIELTTESFRFLFREKFIQSLEENLESFQEVRGVFFLGGELFKFFDTLFRENSTLLEYLLGPIQSYTTHWLQNMQQLICWENIFTDVAEYFTFYNLMDLQAQELSLDISCFPSKMQVAESACLCVSQKLMQAQSCLDFFEEEQVSFIVQKIIENAEFLEFTNNRFLLDQALHMQILLDPREQQNPKHPYNVQKQCLDFRKQVISDFELAQMLVQEKIETICVTLNLTNLCKNSSSSIRYKELQDPVEPDVLEILFRKLSYKIQALALDKQHQVYETIACKTGFGNGSLRLEELKAHFESLKDNFTKGGYLVPALMNKRYQPEEIVSVCAVRLYSIVRYILELPCESEEILTPQEEALLSISASIQGCFSGQSGGIALVYNWLGRGKKALLDTEERVLHLLDFSIEKIKEDLLFSESSFMRKVTEQNPVVQLAHQTVYLQNVLGPELGLEQSYVFDVHSCCIADALLAKSKKELLYEFYQEFTPIRVFKGVKSDLNRALRGEASGFIYQGICELLSQNMVVGIDGIWDVQESIPVVILNQEYQSVCLRESLDLRVRDLLVFLQDKELALQDQTVGCFEEEQFVFTKEGISLYRTYLQQNGFPSEYEAMWPSLGNSSTVSLTQEGVYAFFCFLRKHGDRLYINSLYIRQNSSKVLLTRLGRLKFTEFLQERGWEKEESSWWSLQDDCLDLTVQGLIRFQQFEQQTQKKQAQKFWTFLQEPPRVQLTDFGVLTLLKSLKYFSC